MNNLPFKQDIISENEAIRVFSQETKSSEFIWHKDREDREVSPLEKTDWMFQMDNELPKIIEGKIFIPRETYHRIIKGTGDLKVKIKFNH